MMGFFWSTMLHPCDWLYDIRYHEMNHHGKIYQLTCLRQYVVSHVFFFTNVTYSTWMCHSTSHVPYVLIVAGVRFGYMQHWRFWGVMFFPFSSLSARLSFVHPGKESQMKTLVGRVQKSGIMRVRDPNLIMDQAPAHKPQSGENYGEDQCFFDWDNI